MKNQALIDKVRPRLPLELRDKILNIYRYGSRVYGTHGNKSDEDFIVVLTEGESQWILADGVDLHIYGLAKFEEKLAEHHVPFLECYFLPDELKSETVRSKFTINLTLLRNACSALASNSWVKAKKKIIQGDNYLGLKSLFHSLRILDFAIQMAQDKQIGNYASMNSVWNEIKELESPEYATLKERYQELYNKKASQLRSLCPKY